MRRGGGELFPISVMVLGLLACSGRDSATSGRPNAGPAVAPARTTDVGATDSLALVAQCYRAVEAAHDRSGGGEPVAVEARRAAAGACAKLYQRERCADAWLAAPLGSAPDEMSRVIAECAAAYCPSFRYRVLAVCSGLARDARQRYLDFAELTQAVLELERGAAEAQRMSAHLVARAAPVLAIEAGRVLLDGAEVVRLVDFPTDDLQVPPLLEALRNRSTSGVPVTDIYLRAPEQTGAREINVVIANVRAAGYERVWFCVARDDGGAASGGAAHRAGAAAANGVPDGCRAMRLTR
jgi:hypothetical protein